MVKKSYKKKVYILKKFPLRGLNGYIQYKLTYYRADYGIYKDIHLEYGIYKYSQIY